MKATKTRFNKFTAWLITIAMLMTFIPSFTLDVSATEETTIKNIMLGTDHITGAMASNIYFGNYQQSSAGSTQPSGTENVDWINSTTATQRSQGPYYYKEPIKWRVLSNADGKAFLLSDKNLDIVRYHEEEEVVTWETSTMRSWLNGYGASKNQNSVDYSSTNTGGKDNFIDNAFSADEKAHIADTTVVNDDNPKYNTEGGNNTTDKIFLLSIAEAKNTSYGFTYSTRSTDTRKSQNTAYVYGGGHTGTSSMNGVGEADYWWLRSPGNESNCAANVYDDGELYEYGNNVEYSYYAVRPAFNLNLSSVLFTSAAKGGKAGTTGTLSANADLSTFTDNDGYKLTLKDESRNFSVTDTSAKITGTGEKLSFTYSNAATGTNEYISAMIINSNNEVLYYGQLANVTSASDTVEFVVPSDIALGAYTLKLFNEQINGDYKTDYASDFIDIMPLVCR